MKTRPKPHATPEERRAKITYLRDRLEEWQGEVSEEDIAIFVSIFDGYSPRNACLIAMQRPDATDVRGFREWLAHGRVVRKGEHGIAILAPITRTVSDAYTDEDERRIVNVKIAWVFDVSQTDPLPDPEG
jgi:N-terminal domain of anti-restriction factor ArdC